MSHSIFLSPLITVNFLNKIRRLVSNTVRKDHRSATIWMAYGDCFAMALTRLKKVELYTGNPEFRAIEKEIKIVRL